ncbi:Protein tyrosine phosphatase domain-containing protein 1 [Blomia tropicalis]|nr:Protein tyrosine phosphatase domain-containing protein 1 [Blomia tropicalis]
MLNTNIHLSLDVQSHLPPISPPCRSPMEGDVPSASYTKFSEIIRRSTNGQLQCSMFCGGRKCKYEQSSYWSEKDKAIPELYSHWITEDILAMARPSNESIRKHKLIEMFKKNSIQTIINLQEPGEHSSCGPLLDKSGFTYDPKLFMDKQSIYFYNFKWKDYDGISESSLLDMVKVVTFALSQGKIAIHCHAGLGRTGVLVASYLIYTYRCQAQSAIKFVRMKRPNSIQSRGQILALFKFANHISPCFIVFKSASSKKIHVTLTEFLHRQRILLHGEELRILRYIPKIVFIICEKLIKIAGKSSLLTLLENENHFDESYNFTQTYLSNTKRLSIIVNLNEKKNLTNQELSNLSDESDQDLYEVGNELKSHNLLQYNNLNSSNNENQNDNLKTDDKLFIESLTKTDLESDSISPDLDLEYLNKDSMHSHRSSFAVLKQSLSNQVERFTTPEIVVSTMINNVNTDPNFQSQIFQYQKEINNNPTGWEQLYKEEDMEMLVALLWIWFENFDIPILNNETIKVINENKGNIGLQLLKLNQEIRYTIEYLTRFLIRLCDSSDLKTLFLPDSTKMVTPINHLIRRMISALTNKQINYSSNEFVPKERTSWAVLSQMNYESIFAFIISLLKIIIEEQKI